MIRQLALALASMVMGAAGNSDEEVEGEGKTVRSCSPMLKFRGHGTPGLLKQAPRHQVWGFCSENS